MPVGCSSVEPETRLSRGVGLPTVIDNRYALGLLLIAACSSPPSAPPDAAARDAGAPVDAPAPAPDAARGDAGPCAALPDGADCDDGDECTQIDLCDDGVCVGTTPIVCEVQQMCRLPGTCDPATGDCGSIEVADGTDCDDGSICTRTDTCLDGRCIGGDVVDFPGDPCDDGICFSDVTAAAGIDWTAAPSGTKLIGAGATWLDADGDGWLDLLLLAEGGAPVLYRNDGDGSFTDVTAGSGLPGLPAEERLMAAAAADYDDDGDADLYLYYYGANRLYANDGDGNFSDVTATAGVGGGLEWTTAAAFGDYDGDGDLDLYVGNYIEVEMYPFHTPFPNALYENDGDGTFSDVTATTGTAGDGTTLAVTWSDYDGDGDVDLFVCNDFGATVEPNQLYRNDGGAFTEVAASAGAALEIFCMGVAPGDYDRDGDLDYYFTNLGRNVLLANTAGALSDATTAAGVELTYDACYTDLFATSWSAAFHDFDSDGWLDLYVSNGHIPAAVEIENPETIMNALFRNDGDGTFTDISHTAAIDDDAVGRGAAFADYDQDGDVDVVQVDLEGAILYRNDSPAPGGSIQLLPVGRASNRDGLGLRVAAAGQRREVAAHTGYQATSERAVHVGLGTAAEADVSFVWPSGIAHQWLHVPTGTRAPAVEPDVTIEATSLLTDPVAEGASAQLELTLRNHTASPRSVDATATLRVPGESPVTGSPASATVPPSGTTTVTASVTVPAGITGGSATTAELAASVVDASAARDDRAAALTVTP